MILHLPKLYVKWYIKKWLISLRMDCNHFLSPNFMSGDFENSIKPILIATF